ncbi:MAG: tetratricopeptide repeat protein, partial [Chloroflexota bacterium]
WLIGGESGVGKSRLLDELRTEAIVDGWQVLRGQALESGRLPYQLWREIVPHLVLNTDLSTLELSILKEIAPHIDRLVDETIPLLTSSNGSIDQERLAATLVETLERQSQPTLLLLEDVHWARESLALLKEILSRLSRLPQLVVIATYRSDEAPALPAELAVAESLILDRLSESEVEQLSKAILGDRIHATELVSLLTQETEGNTFFIVEVMRALAEDAGQLNEISKMALPAGVLTHGMQSLLQRRIQQIPAADQSLLETAAVAGRLVDLSLLAAIAPQINIRSWQQRTLDASVLAVRDDQWFFSHDKLRETLINGLEPETERQHHRQIATALETLYPEARRSDQSLLEHWHQAGDLDKEIRYLEPVAQYLIQAVADLNQARRLLKRGLDQLNASDSRRIGLLNWLAYTYSEQFDKTNLELAFDIVNQALELAEAVEDTLAIADSLYRLGSIRYLLGYADQETVAYVEKSLAYARLGGDPQKISDNLMLLGEISHHLGNFDNAIAYHKESYDVIVEIGSPYREGFSLDHIGQAYVVQGKYEMSVEYFERSLEAYEAGGYEQRLGWTLLNMATPPLLLGRYAEATNHLKRCLTLFQKYEIQLGIAYGLNNMGRVATLTENYADAKAFLHQSSEIFRSSELSRGIGYNLLQLGLIAIIQEEHEIAEAYLQEALVGFKEIEEYRFVAYSLARLGFVYLHIKPDQARDTLLQALELAQSLKIEPCILEIIFGFALFYLYSEEFDLAAQLTGLAKNHPKSNKEIQLWLRVLDPQLNKVLPPNELAAALEHGQSLALDTVVRNLLTHQPQVAIKR